MQQTFGADSGFVINSGGFCICSVYNEQLLRIDRTICAILHIQHIELGRCSEHSWSFYSLLLKIFSNPINIPQVDCQGQNSLIRRRFVELVRWEQNVRKHLGELLDIRVRLTMLKEQKAWDCQQKCILSLKGISSKGQNLEKIETLNELTNFITFIFWINLYWHAK